MVQHPETMNGRVFQTLCRNAGIEPEVVVSTQNLITEASLCMEGMGACVLPLTFLSPDQRLSGHGSHPPVQPGGLDRLAIFLLDTSGIGRLPDLSLPPEEQAAHPGGPGIHQPGPGNLQRRQRWSNTASIHFESSR